MSPSLQALMAAEGDMDSEGNVVYSDQDEEGNLR